MTCPSECDDCSDDGLIQLFANVTMAEWKDLMRQTPDDAA